MREKRRELLRPVNTDCMDKPPGVHLLLSVFSVLKQTIDVEESYVELEIFWHSFHRLMEYNGWYFIGEELCTKSLKLL